MAKSPARPRLSRETIIDTALALIEDEGLDNLSTRAIGKRLGVQAMSLYHYVTGKEELLDLVAARLAGMIVFPVPSDDWRGELEAIARSYVAIARRHPRAFPLLAMRRYNARETLPVLESAFTIYRRAGLGPEQAAWAFRLQGYFMNGAGLAEVATAEAARRPDFRLADPAFVEGFPETARAVPFLAAGNMDAIFEKGLQAVLDAIEDEARAAKD